MVCNVRQVDHFLEYFIEIGTNFNRFTYVDYRNYQMSKYMKRFVFDLAENPEILTGPYLRSPPPPLVKPPPEKNF